MNDSIRVYAACLASYNNGLLYGRWIEVSGDEDELNEEIQKMLADSPQPNAEEWAFHDTEGPASSLIGEYTSVAKICEIAQFVEENDSDVIRAAVQVSGGFAEFKEAMKRYEGSAESARGWCEERAYDLGELTEDMPTMYLRAIDWDVVVNDYECQGVRFVRNDGTVHVFDFSY